MNLQLCNHIRIRGGEGHEMDVETLVKSIECKFKKDFTTLPNWKELLKNIGDKKQEYESKIKSANRRKLFIIDKLHVQNFRPSPFSLTDNLARTAYVWEDIKLENTKRKELLKLDAPSVFYLTTDLSEEISGMNLTAHPNSEIYQSENVVEPTIQATPVDVETSITNLPFHICTNQHKLISPLESDFSGLSIKQRDSHEISSILGTRDRDFTLIKQTNCIKCKPPTILIDKNILKKQVVKFFLTNSCTESLYIRFKTISDKSPFKKATIYPKTPIKLCPGLTATYNFAFKLIANMDNLKIYIYFRIGRNVLFDAPEEIFLIPVFSEQSKQEEMISVTETVNIIPVYSWQINVNAYFPHEKLEISVNDDHCYNVHVKKRSVDFIEDAETHNLSVEVTGVNTESLMQNIDEDDFGTHSVQLCPSRKEDLLDKEECTSNTGIISLLLDDIVNRALDTFIFGKTFIYLPRYSKRTMPILFSKAEHEGYHQCYYDLDFYDPDSEILITTKTVKIFAEVLSHPVQIHPKILDMSESPIKYGFREDHIVVTNNHKFYSVTLRVKVTKKMRRLFQISPMELTVPYSSSANFVVRVCSRKCDLEQNKDDLVHFTIKIIISGHTSIYRNVPPIFYEIIIPCAAEFKKIYNTCNR